jgi:hypothetical protein
MLLRKHIGELRASAYGCFEIPFFPALVGKIIEYAEAP